MIWVSNGLLAVIRPRRSEGNSGSGQRAYGRHLDATPGCASLASRADRLIMDDRTLSAIHCRGRTWAGQICSCAAAIIPLSSSWQTCSGSVGRPQTGTLCRASAYHPINSSAMNDKHGSIRPAFSSYALKWGAHKFQQPAAALDQIKLGELPRSCCL